MHAGVATALHWQQRRRVAVSSGGSEAAQSTAAPSGPKWSWGQARREQAAAVAVGALSKLGGLNITHLCGVYSHLRHAGIEY